MTNFTGTSGDDDLIGTADGDEFGMEQAGHDTVRGLGGTDIFSFGAFFDRRDHVFGGTGEDAILLSGDYDLTFGSKTIRGVQQIFINDGFDYRFVLHDDNVAAGETFIMNGSILTGEHDLIFNAQAETDGAFLVEGGTGDDAIATGAGNDDIRAGDGDDTVLPGAGKDVVNTGLGAEDVVVFGPGEFSPNDSVDGVDLGDHVSINGDYSAGFAFKSGTIRNLQHIELGGGFSYSFDAGKVNPYDGFFLIVNGGNLGTEDSLVFDAAGNPDGAFSISGGAGEDVLSGAAGMDTFTGNGGADTLTGKGGIDTHIYLAVSDSAGKKFDTVNGFDAENDFFYVTFDDFITMHVTGVDQRVNGGRLSSADFNADLADAIGAGEMAEDHAVLFKPDAGGYAGSQFLIIDGNDVAGYQAGADIVIRLVDGKNMGAFDFSNFGTPG
jgi:hypothetical protein